MKQIEVFSVEFNDDMDPVHLGLFSKEDLANQVSKGNGYFNQDAKVIPKTITIFDSVEEYIAETGKKVLSSEEIKERLKKIALDKLTPEERESLGY